MPDDKRDRPQDVVAKGAEVIDFDAARRNAEVNQWIRDQTQGRAKHRRELAARIFKTNDTEPPDAA